MIITIDGPVASGKSAVARLLAHQRHLFYINSGMLFRAIAYLLAEKCHLPIEQLVTLTHDQIVQCLNLAKLKYLYQGETEQILYDGENITWHLKTADMDHAASVAGTNPDIRELLLEIERKLAEHHDIVIDGRDTGSVVFPQADVKIYLTASPEVRAQRWQKDQAGKGNNLSLKDALQEINKRDERDKTRLVAPLVKPDKALVIDSSDKTLNEIVAQIERFL